MEDAYSSCICNDDISSLDPHQHIPETADLRFLLSFLRVAFFFNNLHCFSFLCDICSIKSKQILTRYEKTVFGPFVGRHGIRLFYTRAG